MDIQIIRALLAKQFPDSHIETHFEGSHLNVLIVSDAFTGLGPVKKQQAVYAVLNDKIASGEIHAVNIRAFSPAQWADRQ